MANGYKHAALESIPGNETNSPTLSTKVIYEPIQSADIQLNPNPDEPRRRAAQRRRAARGAPGGLRPELGARVARLPGHARVRAAAMLGLPVTTAGDGIITDPDTQTIPVGATRHVWTAPFGPSGLSPKTVAAAVRLQGRERVLQGQGLRHRHALDRLARRAAA
jgi:hypothetical protein